MGLVTVINKNELSEGKGICTVVDSKNIAVFQLDGKYFAVDDECTHAGGSLSEGEISGTTVTCPLHGATFDVTTGAVLSAPAFEGVKSYKVVVEGNEIKIEL